MSFFQATLPEVICNYCNHPARLVRGGEEKGPPGKQDEHFWFCKGCSAWVGIHPNSNFKPLGRLANEELRMARKYAQLAFAKVVAGMVAIYTTNQDHARRKAYGWLAKRMFLPKHECHINLFTPAQCDQATVICNNYVDEREIGEKA